MWDTKIQDKTFMVRGNEQDSKRIFEAQLLQIWGSGGKG